MAINDPRDPHISDQYRAPSEALRIGLGVAAAERALAADHLRGLRERRARTIIEQLVQELGAIWVITCVQSVADCRDAEGL